VVLLLSTSMFFFTTYGDDLIGSVHSEVEGLFSTRVMADIFSSFGLKFTGAFKTEPVEEYVKFDECSFLKRGFVLHPRRGRASRGQYLAPLAVASIEEIVQWKPKGFVSPKIDLDLAGDMVRISYTRGPDYYEDLGQRVVSFWRDRGYHFVLESWDTVDVRVFEYGQRIMKVESGMICAFD